MLSYPSKSIKITENFFKSYRRITKINTKYYREALRFSSCQRAIDMPEIYTGGVEISRGSN